MHYSLGIEFHPYLSKFPTKLVYVILLIYFGNLLVDVNRKTLARILFNKMPLLDQLTSAAGKIKILIGNSHVKIVKMKMGGIYQ